MPFISVTFEVLKLIGSVSDVRDDILPNIKLISVTFEVLKLLGSVSEDNEDTS